MPSSNGSLRLRGAARLAAYFAATAAIVAALIGGALLARESVAVLFALSALAMAALLLASVWWWRGVDEAVREAHKAAWFWGGLVAVCAATPFLLLLAGMPEQRVRSALGDEPYDLFSTGALACLLVQLAGYAVAWAVWWLKRR